MEQRRKSSSPTKGPGSPIARTCSSPSSPPSHTARALGWCSAGRSPKHTPEASPFRTRPADAAATRCCVFRFRRSPDSGIPPSIARCGAFRRRDHGSLGAACVQTGRTAHPGAAEPAVPLRVLLQVLLMVVLSVVELGSLPQLGGDAAVARCLQYPLVGVPGRFRGLSLLFAVPVDRRPILGSDVVTLAHSLRRIVILPKHLEQLV